MDDIGFQGIGSRFNTRFGAGEDIYASQLNGLAAGIQSALGIPYLGAGQSVSFVPGGNIITQLPEAPAAANVPVQQFQIQVVERENKQCIQVAKGFIIWPGYISGSSLPHVRGLLQAKVERAYVYPTGSLIAGTATDSPWVSTDGAFEIKPGP